MDFKEILESEKVLEYLAKRKLLKQYLKAKSYILDWKPELADLKQRQPKNSWIYYFRINKQFRALWIEEVGIDEITKKEIKEIKILKVLKISNHQEN